MLFEKDAVYYSEQIKNGEMTVSELVERTIENIETLNPTLNAVTFKYYDEARQQAEAYDAQLTAMSEDDRQKLPVFYGVPLVLKDLGQQLKGTIAASGSVLLKENKALQTDAAVQKALDAGFIPIGRSNVPEFGLKTVSDSKYFGLVKNPVDLTRNPGGSSGGAAAAVKSGMVPLATGSDAGGSIRVPASDTGLIGLKPSRGRVADGPHVYRRFNALSTNLVFSHSVRDVFEYLQVVQQEQVTSLHRLPEIQEKSLKALDRPLKIAYTKQHPRGLENGPEAMEAVEQTIDLLQALGHEVIEVDLAVDGDRLMDFYYVTLLVETGRQLSAIEKSGQVIDFETIDPLAWTAYKVGPTIPAFVYSEMNEFVDQLFEYMETLYRTYDLLLTPAASEVAAKNDSFVYSNDLLEKMRMIGKQENMFEVAREALDSIYLRTPYSQLMNLSGQPAISLPIYENAEGLPLGSQFAAARGNEYLLLQLAKQLEEKGHLKAQTVEIQ